MYRVNSPRAYVAPQVWDDPRSAPRAQALLAACGNPPVVELTREAIPDIVADNPWAGVPARTVQLPPGGQPTLILNNYRFDVDRAHIDAVLARCPKGTTRGLVERLVGYWHFHHWSSSIRNGEQVCRRGYEWNPIWGCLHRCTYCSYGGSPVLALTLNVEEMFERHIAPTIEANPHLTVWRYEMASSDSLSVEPEYGAVKAYVEHFAAQPNAWFLIHTKSANVDHLLDLDHRGHTIIVWSLTSHTVSRHIEQDAATTEERIEAARKCQQAGYTVRIKYKPIVPVANWRAECRDMTNRLLDVVQPDVISLCTLMWMKLPELHALYPPGTLDPAFVQAAHDHEATMCDGPASPFPDDVRAEIYQFCIDAIRARTTTVPVSLCTETLDMWQRFGPQLGYGPRDYPCGCGSRCVPGTARLAEPEVLAGIDTPKS